MIQRLSDIKVTMLAWAPLPPNGATPPETTCLYSDGVEFFAGWYKGDHILVKAGDGPHGIYQISAFRRARLKWAKLNNMVAIFEGTAGKAAA